MHDLLEAEPKLAEEVTAMVKKNGLKSIIDELKDVAFKKKYKVGKKQQQAQVISKDGFICVGHDNMDGGFSEEAIAAIEKECCLPKLNDFY